MISLLQDLLALVVFFIFPGPVFSKNFGGYQAVPGLIDLRTTFSDGSHSVEEMVQLARSRGFRVLFLNDHDRISLSYGLPPFRSILSYKKEYPSIMTHGPRQYLDEVKRISALYPDMVIVPGFITSPFYYWTGSWFTGDLTLHLYDRRVLVLDMNDAEAYQRLPVLGNGLSSRYTRELAPGAALFLIPLFLGVLLFFWKGRLRTGGIILAVFSCMAIVEHHPFKSSRYGPYGGDHGIAPYQEVIDYVQERGGLSFWNYPEQKSGIRRHGPIFVHTPPYPEVLRLSNRYSGFAAIYGDTITVTEPGGEWDRVLNEFCQGLRSNPPWGIATADFHEEGRLGLRLGSFPTTFLVENLTRESVIEAIKKGRMYCSRGDGAVWPVLKGFQVSGHDGRRAVMGETLNTSHPPLIEFTVSFQGEKAGPMEVLLIRGGSLIHTIKGETPLEVRIVDENLPAGETTYYRIMDSKKHLTSNPIFVRYTRGS